jgi:hypothetical protein
MNVAHHSGRCTGFIEALVYARLFLRFGVLYRGDDMAVTAPFIHEKGKLTT